MPKFNLRKIHTQTSKTGPLLLLEFNRSEDIGGFGSVLCVSVFQGLLLVIVIMIDGSQKRNFMLHSKFQSFHVAEKCSKRCLLSDGFTLDIESSFKLNVACRGALSNFG